MPPHSRRGRRPNQGAYLLYQGDSGLSSLPWSGDAASTAGHHDHRIWGCDGILHNTLIEPRSRCVDDRTREGYAHLRQGRRASFRPREITLLIRQMDNFAGRINYLRWETALGEKYAN